MSVAVVLMFAGAALALVAIAVTLATLDSLRADLRIPGLTTSEQIDTKVATLVAITVITSLVKIGLWSGMALTCLRGYNWARVTSTVLFALSVVWYMITMLTGGTLWETLNSLISLALGGTVMALLWKKESSLYFQPDAL